MHFYPVLDITLLLHPHENQSKLFGSKDGLKFWWLPFFQLKTIPLQRYATQLTEVLFASFFPVGFITAIVINPPERRLAKRTSVQCTVLFQELPIFWYYNAVLVEMCLMCLSLNHRAHRMTWLDGLWVHLSICLSVRWLFHAIKSLLWTKDHAEAMGSL